mmetsp:Transcript_7765/g.12544  ORF Transcript_7765/g.12544 Transcript_7765/m.12544 type:complete len:366 (+) Transcript_7765:165-1262(+)
MDGNVPSVLEALSGKGFIFVGGKGGVGKTTTSCSLALTLSKKYGKRVLLISTDPAHNVSDSLGQQFSGTTQAVSGVDNLWAVETDPTQGVEKLFGETEKLAGDGDMGQQIKMLVADMRSWLGSLPGVDEAVALMEILQTEDKMEDKYDCVVLDTAPTGHTLKLLQLPAVLEIGITKLEGWKAKLGNYLNMAVMFFGQGGGANPGPTPTEQLAGKLKQMKASVELLKSMLTDVTKTTFVCVGIAEALSVLETGRLIKSLGESKVHTNVMLVNHLFTKTFLDTTEDDNPRPAKAQKIEQAVKDDGGEEALKNKALVLCRERAKIQNKYLQQLREQHGKTHTIIQVEELAYEPKGIDQLLRFAESWAV